MSEKKQGMNRGERAVIGIVLCLAALLMFYMAFQCITTVEYGLYQKNQSYYAEKASHYDEYITKAAECRAQAENGGEYSAIYARRALDWEEHAEEAQGWAESAREAQAYLTQKKAGHGILMLAGLFSAAGALWCFLPHPQRKKKQ